MPLWAYLAGIPVFGLMILAHEAGHYLVARRRKIAVAEFALGFGPRLYSFDRAGTTWTVRLLPLGGYVRWEEEGVGAFADSPLGARFQALVAGPLANLVLAFFLLAVLFVGVMGQGWEGLLRALRFTWLMTAGWVMTVIGLFQGVGLGEVAGPVGIVQVTAQAALNGPEQLLILTAFLSVNIGLFNLLPFPALDGGRLIFLAVERLRRRALDPYVEGWIHAGGFLLLMGLVFFTVVKDLLV